MLAFTTKALNIQNSYTSVTPKVAMHVGVIGLHLLHSPPFFSEPHGLLHSTFSHEPNVKDATHNAL